MSSAIHVSYKGSFEKSLQYMTKVRTKNVRAILEAYGKKGVEALATATPKATGKTAASWSYEIKMEDTGAVLYWKNSNIVDGVPIAVILQYGHGTRNGGYVQGLDYINPAMRPIFEEIAKSIWKEVRK